MNILTKPFLCNFFPFNFNIGTTTDSIYHTVAETCSTGGTDSPTGRQFRAKYKPPVNGIYKISSCFTIKRQMYQNTPHSLYVYFKIHELNYLNDLPNSQGGVEHGCQVANPVESWFWGDEHTMFDYAYLKSENVYDFKLMKKISSDNNLYSLRIMSGYEYTTVANLQIELYSQ